MELFELRQMQALPLEAKILKTQLRIREWYNYWHGDVYVSFSGGKDSTVLLHMAREIYPDIPAVFSDTGLEFPEIREFVKTIPNVTWLKPDMNFRKVLETHGYPVVGKDQAHWIEQARNGNPSTMKNRLYGIMTSGRKTSFKISEQWHYLLNAPLLVSAPRLRASLCTTLNTSLPSMITFTSLSSLRLRVDTPLTTA